MKTKQAASAKKPTITVKDLRTRKNPKGGTFEVTHKSGYVDRSGASNYLK